MQNISKLRLLASNALKFDRVTFKYAGQGEPAIRDFSLEIQPGEKVALVGRTGSGKRSKYRVSRALERQPACAPKS